MSTQTATAEPSVKLPKAVQRQLQKAEEIREELEKKFKEKTPDGKQTPEDKVTATAEPKQTEPEPAPEPEKVTKPEPKKDEPERDAKYWEHRFKTAQGIYEADKRRLKAEHEELQARLEALEKQPVATPVEVPNLEDFLSKEEIEAYGPDVMNAVLQTAQKASIQASERRFAEELKRQLDPLKGKLEATETQLHQQREDIFWDTLQERQPDWAEINEDIKFKEWLAQRDPVSGMYRQHLLESAQQALDAERVVALFGAYLQNSPASKGSTISVTVDPDPLAAPDPNTNASVPAEAYVTRQEIKDFYRDVALGRYRSRPEAKKLMEDKINAATAAGHVR